MPTLFLFLLERFVMNTNMKFILKLKMYFTQLAGRSIIYKKSHLNDSGDNFSEPLTLRVYHQPVIYTYIFNVMYLVALGRVKKIMREK